jgi:small neutral amino acid transporter SnatA (MarC family)
MTTVLLLRARQPGDWPSWLFALLLAWLATGVILSFAGFFGRLLGARGALAIQRLMGMLLTTVAVEMFLAGLRKFLAT